MERQLEKAQWWSGFTSKAANAGQSREWQRSWCRLAAKAKIRQWFAKGAP